MQNNASATTVAQQAENELVKGTDTSPTDGLLDFDSDEPLKICPMRNNGDEVCESCQ